MEQIQNFYGMLAFLTVTLVGGYIAAIIFLNFKPKKSTEAMIARRALRSLNVDTQPSWKTVIISASRDVEVPIEKLWETWSKLEDWPEWSAMHASARWAGEPSWQVGAQFEQALKLGLPFMHLHSVDTVSQYCPEQEVGWCKKSGLIKSCHIWSFTMLPNKRVRVTTIEVFHGTAIGILKPIIFISWQKKFEKSILGLVNMAAQAA
jgi:hypothetical protein